jgi:hypothetical protein
MKAFLFAVAVVAAAGPAAAQSADSRPSTIARPSILLGVTLSLSQGQGAPGKVDGRWEPFLGCWDLTADNVRENAPAVNQLTDTPLATRSRAGSGPRVCVTRTPDGGARFETTVRGQSAIDQTLFADGTSRPLNDAECRGTQRAEFSNDGMRIFSRAELTCEGDPGPRRVAGISLLALNGTWVDVQAVDIAGRETVRVRRYYRAEGEPRIPSATLSASNLSLDDIKEASTKTVPRALEAALVETSAGFFLTGRQLVDLDNAGVPDSVTDLIVALSYPEQFVVERTARSSGGGGTFINDPFGLGWAFGYPVWYDDFLYSPYYYSPFGYSRYGYRGYSSDGFGEMVLVGVNPGPQPSGNARAVDGQGYTRIRPRETASADDGGLVTRGSSSSFPSGGGSSTSSSGGSSTASSGGGYSSGGGGGDGGRTAQPR